MAEYREYSGKIQFDRKKWVIKVYDHKTEVLHGNISRVIYRLINFDLKKGKGDHFAEVADASEKIMNLIDEYIKETQQ